MTDATAWITVKGEDAQATERLAEAILRCLNLAPDLTADVKPDHSADEASRGDRYAKLDIAGENRFSKESHFAHCVSIQQQGA